VICAAWIGHTDRSRALAQCIDGARRALGWTEKELADKMGLCSREELAQMLAGRKPLNLFRLADLPDTFHAAYDARRAGLRGAVVLEAPDLSLIRGACALGEKRMASFTDPVYTIQDRRQA